MGRSSSGGVARYQRSKLLIAAKMADFDPGTKNESGFLQMKAKVLMAASPSLQERMSSWMRPLL